MIIKIKGFFLLISLIFIQSCSGGSIGNFLESSFDNLENRNKTEDPNNISEKKKFLNVQNNFDKPKNNNKVNSFAKKRKNELQSYKIIFILKDVDPKDPIEELSTILRNSEVNFEIEKIERFIDTKNNKLKRN